MGRLLTWVVSYTVESTRACSQKAVPAAAGGTWKVPTGTATPPPAHPMAPTTMPSNGRALTRAASRIAARLRRGLKDCAPELRHQTGRCRVDPAIVQVPDPLRRRLHSPRAARIMVTPPSAPSAQSVHTKKKPPADAAISG